MLALLAVAGLAGCPLTENVGPCGDVECAEHIKPEIVGSRYFLLSEPDSLALSWADYLHSDCTWLDPCHSDAFVIDEVECEGCTVEIFVQPSGAGMWVPAKGLTISNAEVSLRLTPLSVGSKTLRMVLRSVEHPDNEIIETVEHHFTVDRVVSIAGACMTGPHREYEHQITVAPCSAVRVVGDSLYVHPTLQTERGYVLTDSENTARIKMSPAPTRRVSVQLMVNTAYQGFGEYENPSAELREVSLTGTYAGQTFTSAVALPPAP